MDQIQLRLAAFDGEVFAVRLTGQEGLSRLYHFDVWMAVEGEEGLADRVLETAACVFIGAGADGLRSVCGIVTACEATGERVNGLPSYVVRIEPRLALLERRKTSRIFQDLTAQEIVTHVLDLSKVKSRWALHRRLPKRVYCVQYDETDFAFVSRICASEGIFFTFEHAADSGSVGEETVVFLDSAEAYLPLEGGVDLHFRPSGGGGSSLNAAEDSVFRFGLRRAMRPKRVLFRRFDVEKPPIPVRDSATLDRGRVGDDLESMAAFVESGATFYEHHQAREQALLNPMFAKTALEAETADAAVAEGETACRRLVPGHRFQLLDHTLSELDGAYAVVACSHEAVSPQAARSGEALYNNRFSAVPAAVPFRPARPARVVRQTLETATVVGPPGQEIFTDEMGRVKVQFHWDLHGKFTDRSSCWLRVVQAWAGAGYGTQFLPRVGSEVLVGYIDGDADRPVVMGCLHNGLNATPFSFPQDHERSGIKTWSSPDGKGGHELMFDDRAGAELISMRSARTMALSSAEDMSVRAEGNLNVVSGGHREEEVLRDVSALIGGSERHEVKGDRRTEVGGDETVQVAGTSETEVGGNEVHRVGGIALHIYAESRSTIVGARANQRADEHLGVSGQYKASSADDMTFSSKTQIQLVCGETKITLTPDSILLSAPTIQLQAKDKIALVQGDPAQATLVLEGSASIAGGTVVAKGGGKGGGTLLLDADAHLDGAFVKLNCGAGGGGGAEVIHSSEEKGLVRFTVRKEGVPDDVKTVTLVIATPTGEVIERECAVGGTVELEGKKGEVFTVVETRIGDKVISAQKTGGTPEKA